METNARTVSGALVQPVSLTGLVALPMFAPRAVSWRADDVLSPASSDLDERLDELDARVEALHLRAMTIQRSVELQTKILEEIKSSGTIGGVAIPGLRQDIAPEAKPAEPTVAPDQDTAAAAVQDQHRFTVESLGKLREELEMDPEKNAELLKSIDKVKTGLEALLKPAPAP